MGKTNVLERNPVDEGAGVQCEYQNNIVIKTVT